MMKNLLTLFAFLMFSVSMIAQPCPATSTLIDAGGDPTLRIVGSPATYTGATVCFVGNFHNVSGMQPVNTVGTVNFGVNHTDFGIPGTSSPNTGFFEGTITITLPNGTITSCTYDVAGNLLAIPPPVTGVTSQTLNNTVAVTNCLGGGGNIATLELGETFSVQGIFTPPACETVTSIDIKHEVYSFGPFTLQHSSLTTYTNPTSPFNLMHTIDPTALTTADFPYHIIQVRVFYSGGGTDFCNFQIEVVAPMAATSFTWDLLNMTDVPDNCNGYPGITSLAQGKPFTVEGTFTGPIANITIRHQVYMDFFFGTPVHESFTDHPNPTSPFNLEHTIACDAPLNNGSDPPSIVTLVATDANGTVLGSCTAYVAINGGVAPVITCPSMTTIEDCTTDGLVPVFATVDTPTSLTDFTDSGGMADECAADASYIDVASGTCPIVVTRTWTITDACGANPSSCDQIINIDDTTPPVIACPDDITLTCDQDTDPSEGDEMTGMIAGASTGNSSWTDGTTGLAVGSLTAPTAGAPAGAEITGVTVDLDLSHSWVGDIGIELVSPDGTVIELMAPNDCNINSDNVSATFTDAGVANPCNTGIVTPSAHEDCIGSYTAGASVSGLVLPNVPLATLNGETANGTWTLNINDDTGGDGGCLENFSVAVDWFLPAPGGDAGPSATAADVCDPDVTITYTDVLNPLMEGYSISRTWFATDACGNIDSCLQTITVEACDFAIEDPCVCVNNASVIDLDTGLGGGDGQFSELVSVTGPNGGPVNDPNLIFEVIAATGGVDAFAAPPTPPAQTAGVPIPLGTQLVYNPATMHYELPFYHYDGVGYSITVQQMIAGAPGQTLGPVGNNCIYPSPVFDPMLQSLYCPNAAAVTLGGTDQNGVGADGVTFTVDGAPATEFNPSALPKGTYTVLMTFDGADDGNGGLSPDGGTTPAQPGCIQEVMQSVEINDVEDPVITSCPADVSLACTASTDPGDTGAATATDNCDPAPAITFEDVSTEGTEGCSMSTFEILRTWTATDACGNTATCVQSIAVSDTEAPVISCPTDQMLTCFESVPAPFTNAADFIAAGGTIADNCTSDLDDFTVIAQNDDNGGDNCPGNAREVVRTYFIADACGNTSTCTQTFTYSASNTGPVITSILPTCFKFCADFANPMEADITFTTDCSFGAMVNIDGPTRIGADNCPGTIYRYTYTVTDDCGRTSAPVTRDFIIGNDDPTIEVPAFTLFLECGDANNADYFAAYVALATANASCEQDVNINSLPSSFNNITCNGSTTIEFTAIDACGRTAIATSIVNVSDNTPPELASVYEDGICNEAVCGSNLNFFYNFWKDKVIEGLSATDDCDTNVSISAQGPNSPAQNCPDETTETVVNFVATDNCGNTSFIPYSFYVTAVESPEPQASVAGMMHTEEMEAVEDVEVYLAGGASFFQQFITANDGIYAFNNVPLEQNYSITPMLDQFPMNGVSSYDLILIAQHILNMNQLDSPYKMIAADVNRSGSITTFDMVELRKMILYTNTAFPNNTSWRFVDANFVFPDVDHPFATVFPEIVTINGLQESIVQDFVGVKTGDVNGTAVPNNLTAVDERSFNGDLPFNVQDRLMQVGETYEVTFSSSEFEAIAGYQYTLNFNTDLLEFVNVTAGKLAGVNESNFGLSLLDEGAITTSWTNDAPVSMRADTELFRITFKAKSATLLSDALSINSRYTAAEAYGVHTENGQLNLLNVSLRFEEVATVAGEFQLYQNQPNPFDQQTVIGFNLPKAASATLAVYDISGRLLKQFAGDYDKGYNEVSLDKAIWGTSGVLYYRLTTDGFEGTKKMIVLE